MKKILKCACMLKDNVFRYRMYSTTHEHIYDNLQPWKTNKQFADYLSNNIIYNDHGLIVFNKPYGISFAKDGVSWKNRNDPKKNQPVVKHKTLLEETEGYTGAEMDKINLRDALPYLKADLDLKTLFAIKSPEKYCSGVAIMGTSKKVAEQIQKSLDGSRCKKRYFDSYLAVVSGVPIHDRIKYLRIGVTLDESENHKHRKAILTRKYSKKAVLRSDVRISSTRFNLLTSRDDELASLVELNTSRKKWHFVRLFLASHLLTPAIGDNLFGSRVKKVMGVTLPVNHWNPYASQGQRLDPKLLHLLDLQKGSEKYVPTLIHLSKVVLHNFLPDNKNLIVEAPLPKHFSSTLEKLELELDPKEPLTEQVRQISV